MPLALPNIWHLGAAAGEGMLQRIPRTSQQNEIATLLPASDIKVPGTVLRRSHKESWGKTLPDRHESPSHKSEIWQILASRVRSFVPPDWDYRNTAPPPEGVLGLGQTEKGWEPKNVDPSVDLSQTTWLGQVNTLLWVLVVHRIGIFYLRCRADVYIK